jgi:hypothetical protein
VTSKRIQYLLAAVFVLLGGWCMVAPASVIALAVRPDYRSDGLLLLVTMSAFGAQAVLAGLFAAFSIFTKRTFLALGLALLPFFVFDYYFYAVVPLLTEVGLLDVLGNVTLLILCWLGWRSAPEGEG